MTKLNCLFIGFDESPTKKINEKLKLGRIIPKQMRKSSYPEKEWIVYEFEDLSLFDYQIIFLSDLNNLAKEEYDHGLLPYLKNTKENLSNFLIEDGILCIFLSNLNSFFIDYFVNIKHQSGKNLLPVSNHWLNTILRENNFKFQWSGIISLSEGMEYQETLFILRDIQLKILNPAGLTPNNQIVSCTFNYLNKGRIIILPSPVRMSTELLRKLLDRIKERYYTQQMAKEEIQEPEWITNYMNSEEVKLKQRETEIISKFKNIQPKLNEFAEDKQILYLDSYNLTDSVGRILDKLGFDVEIREHEGKHDIEIKKDDFEGLIEVRGKKGYANNDDLRQLIHHHGLEKDKRPNLKGIFIVNHYREIEPNNRKEAYTNGAIDAGNAFNFCLMTTYDLYKMYLNKMDIKDIIELISNTNGILRLD